MKMENFEDFSKVKVLVIGDVMLDRYWSGSVERISPEAPVPVVNLKETTLALGGAANVAANIEGLGAESFLIGAVGDDDEAKLFFETLEKSDVSSEYLLSFADRATTTKTRIVAHNQQVLRLDKESKKLLSPAQEEIVWNKIEAVFDKTDVVIASDYAKGVLTDSLLRRLIKYCRLNDKKILIDPKGKNYSKYSGATILTPNAREAADACKLDDENLDVERAGEILLSEINLDALLITQGEFGMTLFQKDEPAMRLSAQAREIYDVTGAGDTVIAALAVSVGAGSDWASAAGSANIAAGLVVEQFGTTAVKLEDLKEFRDKTIVGQLPEKKLFPGCL